MRAAALLQRLPHADPKRSRQARRRGRRWMAAPSPATLPAPGTSPAPITSPAPATPSAPTATSSAAPPAPVRDAALARAREAGGPIDNASYTCACGFVFAASVSTTVACPHCGADQAW